MVATTRFAAIGVTWSRGPDKLDHQGELDRQGEPDHHVVRARWRRVTGGWTPWQVLPRLAHGPDADTAEAAGASAATDLLWTGPSDAVQVEVPGDLRDPVLVLLRPRRRAADAHVEDQALKTAAAGARGTEGVPMPGLFRRQAWSPNPRLRNGRPTYNKRIRQVHVHHTVNSNDYARADVPGMIRAMYRYHTKNLGWSDIGYNFLVDRFGRLWVGRAGGPRRSVRGAHTLGFNHASVGVAAIGNFETRRVGKPMIRALVRVAAWKLDAHDGHPRQTVWIRSAGSDRFAEHDLVELPTIDGHRDTNATACPGDHLYAVLPAVRRRTARRIRQFRRR